MDKGMCGGRVRDESGIRFAVDHREDTRVMRSGSEPARQHGGFGWSLTGTSERKHLSDLADCIAELEGLV